MIQAAPVEAPPRIKAWSQYDTPSWIAERMVAWTGVRPGMRVLEPSAGLGCIATLARSAGAYVECIEIDPERRTYLTNAGHHVICDDFLAVKVPTSDDEIYDLVLGNPPFEGGQDLEHVLHALEFAPRVVMLLPLGNLDGVNRQTRLWSKHTLTRLAVLVRRFRSEGTDMSGKRPFGVFEIIRGKWRTQQSIEWWS